MLERYVDSSGDSSHWWHSTARAMTAWDAGSCTWCRTMRKSDKLARTCATPLQMQSLRTRDTARQRIPTCARAGGGRRPGSVQPAPQPGDPAGSRFRAEVRTSAYSCGDCSFQHTGMDRAVARPPAPHVVLDPLAILDRPNASIAETIADRVKLILAHVHVLQPALEVPAGLHMVVFADHLDPLLSRHQAGMHVFTGVIGAAAVTELHELKIIVNTILVHIVEVRHRPIGTLKRLLRRFPAVKLDHHPAMNIRVPVHEITKVNAAYADIVDLLVAGILGPPQVFRAETFFQL